MKRSFLFSSFSDPDFFTKTDLLVSNLSQMKEMVDRAAQLLISITRLGVGVVPYRLEQGGILLKDKLLLAAFYTQYHLTGFCGSKKMDRKNKEVRK